MNLPSPAPRRNWPRRIVSTLVALVVLAVMAGTFILSYAGVHAIALKAGVSPQLARWYPGLFDAVLVIACVAAIMLRDAAWWARGWAWVVIIAVLAAIGTTDAAHATNYELPPSQTAGAVAAAPAAAVLLAFSLLITVLRYSRAQSPGASPTGRADADPQADPAGQSANRASGTSSPEGEAAPAAAGNQQDYWDTDDDRQFAGQVYPALASEPDDQDDAPGVDAEDAVGSTVRESAPVEPDQDAPPFMTAPLPVVPQLNRVRVTPVPPSDEGD